MGAGQIMIIRHAEKPGGYNHVALQGVDLAGKPDPESLVTLGWQRAGALVTLFAPPWGPRAPLTEPGKIFASNPGASPTDEHSQRPFETVSALAAKLGLIIDTTHKKNDLAKLVGDALGQAGSVLISWQHELIPAIGAEILSRTGTTGLAIPQDWPGTRYDLVWVFDRPSGNGPFTAFQQFAQLLLPSDTAP